MDGSLKVGGKGEKNLRSSDGKITPKRGFSEREGRRLKRVEDLAFQATKGQNQRNSGGKEASELGGTFPGGIVSWPGHLVWAGPCFQCTW